MRNTWVAVGAVVVAVLALARTGAQTAEPVTIGIAVDQPGVAIPSTLYGIFFEDINFAADGGIYAEKVKNRSFEFPDPLMGWKRAAVEGARGSVRRRDRRAAQPGQSRTTCASTSEAGALRRRPTTGFAASACGKGERTLVSLLARPPRRRPGVAASSSSRTTEAGARRRDDHAASRASGRATRATIRRRRRRQPRALPACSSTAPARSTSTWCRSSRKTPGRAARTVCAPTWCSCSKDMKPGFLRFPGGCIVEGRFLDGATSGRRRSAISPSGTLIVNRWNDEFATARRPTTTSRSGSASTSTSSCREDIGAEPLPILNCGMACQFNSGELAPLDALDPYIQDALDLIEFANGPVTSAWGARRAAMGHPAPFNLKMIGVGNEQWGPQYVERFALFAKVLKAEASGDRADRRAPARTSAASNFTVAVATACAS